MFIASHDADNADSQAFMSVDLHLPESLSQWAADTSNDASLVSNQYAFYDNLFCYSLVEGCFLENPRSLNEYSVIFCIEIIEHRDN